MTRAFVDGIRRFVAGPEIIQVPPPMRTNRGFATVTTVLLLGIAFAFAVVLLDAALSGRRIGRNLQETYSAQQSAEAGVHQAKYCMNATAGTNCGGTFGTLYAGQSNVYFGGGKFTVTLSGSGTTRTVTSTGWTNAGRKAIIITDLTSLPPEDAPIFGSAIQSDAGGTHMENNSIITGSIYSNGDVDCQSTTAVITGDASSSKAGGKIEKCRTSFHSRADKILSGSVGGDAYYKTDPTDVAGTTVSGTKYPNSATPAVAMMPVLDLDFWRESAEIGGVIEGDYSAPDNSILGPVKIIGDLTVGTNIDVTVKGPVWVVGNIYSGNGSSFTLDSSFGPYSTAILADDQAHLWTKGFINIENGTSIYGSGNPLSHILFATTNKSPLDFAPALLVGNNATGAVFYAMNGALRLQSGAGGKALAGYRVFIDQNTLISHVASEFTGTFSNSPPGTWRVKEGTWREAK